MALHLAELFFMISLIMLNFAVKIAKECLFPKTHIKNF